MVTYGTGEALATGTGDVDGKTGTAEYGPGNRPPTYVCFIGYRGHVAIAVLVENGRSRGTTADPIVARS